MKGPTWQGVRLALAAAIVLAAGVSGMGCRSFSRTNPAESKPEALPLQAPLASEVVVGGQAEVKEALKELATTEGAVADDADTPVTLLLTTRLTPGKVSVLIDVVNVLSAFLVPKIRESELKVSGSLMVGDEQRVSADATGTITSWELWLPYVFYPPAWPGVVEGWGGDAAVSIYEELTRDVLAQLHARRSEIGPLTSGPAPKDMTPCAFCGEPRGDVAPCPHCGMQ